VSTRPDFCMLMPNTASMENSKIPQSVPISYAKQKDTNLLPKGEQRNCHFQIARKPAQNRLSQIRWRNLNVAQRPTTRILKKSSISPKSSFAKRNTAIIVPTFSRIRHALKIDPRKHQLSVVHEIWKQSLRPLAVSSNSTPQPISKY